VIVGLLFVPLTGWAWLDSALAALVAINILWSGWGLMKESIGGLMDEAVPSDRLDQMVKGGTLELMDLTLPKFDVKSVVPATEAFKSLGIVTAFAAAGVLSALVRPATRQLAGADAATESHLRAKMARGERIAAWLLVITVLCMAVARMF